MIWLENTVKMCFLLTILRLESFVNSGVMLLFDGEDLNGNVYGRTICPLSFVVIAFEFSEFRSGGGNHPSPLPPPRSQTTKKKALSE